MRKTFLRLALCLVCSAALAAGCAKARAATAPASPPLAMPPPPPRVFAPVAEEPLIAAPVVPEAPTAEAPQVPPPPPRRRAAAAPAEPEKPVEPTPAPAAPTPEPQRELRTASTPADAEAAGKIKTLLALSTRNLSNVDYGRLSVAGKEQYDQAKSWGQQAVEALAQRNYVFAETLADKAAKLSTELLGR